MFCVPIKVFEKNDFTFTYTCIVHASVTVQCKYMYFEGYKFCGFQCFPAKRENYFHKNERTPIVTWLNYACNL